MVDLGTIHHDLNMIMWLLVTIETMLVIQLWKD